MGAVSSRRSPSNFKDYFPARLNASLSDGRYKILRKLGEGMSSSTWLVHDEAGLHEKCGKLTRKYFVAKILTVDGTRRHETGRSREIEPLQEIRNCEPWDRDYLSGIYTHFSEDGPMGKQLCIILPLYSTSVSDLRRSSPTQTLPVYTVKNIVLMLVEALGYLHDMNIVHTDVKLDNLLFTNSLYTQDAALKSFLESEPANIEGHVQLNGDDYPVVQSQPIPHGFSWNTRPFDAELMSTYLVEFGQAQRAGEQPTGAYFGWPFTFEPLAGRWLFNPEDGGNSWTVEDDLLAKMMELTGQRFSDAMLRRAKHRNKYFDDAGNLKRIPELLPVPLEDAMANCIEQAADFIRACLRFDYSERASANKLLCHKFLKDAGICC